MKKLDYIVELFTKFIMGISVLVLSIVTSLQVIARFIFSNPIAWGQDIIRLSFIYLVFYGGAYCVLKNEHLNIDIFLTSLNKKYRKYMNIFINVSLIIFFLFIIYYGYIFTKTGINQSAPYLALSMSFYYFSLPSASLIMVYFQIRKLIAFIRGGER